MGSKGGGDAKQRVVDYYISAHYGVCAEADELLEFWYGEKRAWSGSITENSALSIRKGSLFGGNKVEGGLTGTLHVLLGGENQTLPSGAVTALNRNGVSGDASQLPGYRGIFSAFLTGGRGANIGSNTGIVKALWFKLRRRPKGCPFDTVIDVAGMKLANPAGMIYECMINAEWGMGVSPSQLNDDSFSAAAGTLRGEGFGLAAIWHRQESVEDFVGEILNHIDASLAFDPYTGRFRLKLIRGDYEVDDLPVLDPSNSRLGSFDRQGWGETINEIVVKWTSPATEKEETVTVHDTANISVQGGALVSETRDFPYIRTADLAVTVATRELLAASSAMARAEITVNRSAWRLLPGDVVVLNWPIYQFDALPMRVTEVDYGRPGDSEITVSLIEDIFGMPEQTFVSSGGTAWVNPGREPEPLDHQHVISLPYFAVARGWGEETAEALDDTADVAAFLGAHDSIGSFDFDVMEREADLSGSEEWVEQTTADLSPRAELDADLPREVTSTVGLSGLTLASEVVPGILAWVGPFDDTGELALVTAIDEAAYEVTLSRGVLDTVPGEWDAGTSVWFLPEPAVGVVPEEQAVGQTVTLRALTRTSLGVLDVDEASNVSATMNGRMHRPYRPANVRVDGVLWPDPEATTAFPATLTWVGRNRLTETAVLNTWTDGSVTPEDGTTYEVELFAEDGNGVVSSFHVEDVGTATSYEIDLDTTPPPNSTVYLLAEVRAKRTGLVSWQAVRHRLRLLTPPGNVTAEYVPVFAPTNLQAELL